MKTGMWFVVNGKAYRLSIKDLNKAICDAERQGYKVKALPASQWGPCSYEAVKVS